MDQPPTLLQRIDRAIDGVLYHLSAGLMLLMAAVIFGVVVARYFFNAPPLWGEDLPVLIFQWLTYLAIAVATRRGHNLRVTYFVEMLPPAWRHGLDVLMNALVLLMLMLLIWYAVPVVELNVTTRVLSTGWSAAWTYLALPVGCLLMLVYQGVLLARAVAGLRAALDRG
ncbi:MAG: hypothetical protein OHK0024_01450 [Thalassobaculales bacterium]